MVNKLKILFPNYPTLVVRFGVFIIWMYESAKVAVKTTIRFYTRKEYMIKAPIQLSKNPNQLLLTDIMNALTIRNPCFL